MKVCNKCGEEKELSDFRERRNSCKVCLAAQTKAWREINPEKIKEAAKKRQEDGRSKLSQKVYRENHPEKVKASFKSWYYANQEELNISRRIKYSLEPEKFRSTSRNWYHANIEKGRAAVKSWREANPEKMKASIRAWKDANPEKIKIYREANLEVIKARNKVYSGERRALLTGANATLTQSEWKEIWKEFNGLCLWCGDRAEHMDHIVPLRPRKGELQGHHTKGNVVLSCQSCNNGLGGKFNKDPLVFLFERRGLYEAENHQA